MLRINEPGPGYLIGALVVLVIVIAATTLLLKAGCVSYVAPILVSSTDPVAHVLFCSFGGGR